MGDQRHTPEREGPSGDIPYTRLAQLLHDERGYHFKVLAEEYRKMAAHFTAQAEIADRSYRQYLAAGSASPDLLEALKAVTNIHFSSDYTEPDIMNRAMRNARAAIAKAEGKQS